MPFKKGEIPPGAKPFQKGQSGNPNGYKEGQKNRATIARKWLEVEIKAKNPLTGLEEMLSQEDLITLAQIKAALQSESTAYKVLMDSRYGAPKQEVEHSGEVEIGFDIGKLDDEDLKTILQITQKAKNAD